MPKTGIANLLLFAAVVLNFTGLFITILGPDGALYATIAKTMAQQNNFVELFYGGKDWLDKPHFPFWVTALSFKLFGVHTWSYKLPAIFFMMMAARYTYLLAKELYNKDVAIWSAIILLTAEHIVISNNDVRAEPYLTGLVIASVYHFYKTSNQIFIKHLVIGSLFAAAAVMTKGLFALVPIGGAVAGGLLMKKEFRQLIHYRWLVAFILISVFILPELYCLWYQFDQHPEKVIFGKTNVSGVRFFFWDSQFGRFMNNGPIRGKGDPSFFLHTILWAFLPWSVLLYAAFFRKVIGFRKDLRDGVQQEWFTFFGSVIMLLLFSLSKFQLPHYTNILFPFFSIIVASYILSIRQEITKKSISGIQLFTAGLMLVGGFLIQFIFNPGNLVWCLLIFAGCIFSCIYILKRKNYTKLVRVLMVTAISAITVNLYLNLIFYPALLKYQQGSEAAFFLNKEYPAQKVFLYKDNFQPDLEFYLKAPVEVLTGPDIHKQHFSGTQIIFISKENAAQLNVPYTVIKSIDGYHISTISLPFFNYRTRQSKLTAYLLIKI